MTHNREFHGLGLAGRVLRFEYRLVSKSALDRLDKLYQHRYNKFCYTVNMFILLYLCVFCRPFFTYWVSFVQILVMIVVASVYGHAPYGFDFETETAVVILLY